MKKLLSIFIGMIAIAPRALAEIDEKNDGWTLIPTKGDLQKKFLNGNFEATDLIAYGLYLIELLVIMAGVVAVIMIMIGGYRYVIGSFYEDKEGGKNTLQYAIMGFVVSILAWVIVDLIIAFLTVAE